MNVKNVIRLFPAIGIGVFLFLLCGCEDTADYKGVTFKPQEATGEAFDTSVYILAVENNSNEELAFEQSRKQTASMLGRQWIPSKDKTFVLDGKKVFLPSISGVYELQNVQGGVHNLSIASSIGKDRKTLFMFPLTVVRKKMTLVMIDFTKADSSVYKVCSFSKDHDFILKGHFRRLAHSFSEIGTLMEQYRKIQKNGEGAPPWEKVFHKDCRDEQGHISDRLMALRYIQNTEDSPHFDEISWVGSLFDDYSGVVFLRGDETGGNVVDYERFVVNKDKPGETLSSVPLWLITSIGIGDRKQTP